MSNLPNDSDSRELAALRVAFKAASSTRRATPDRLGAFARQAGITITDYGSHSKRWTTQFKRAMPS